MASLTAKKVNGHTYYYLRETARVDGRPKVVRQTYLGSAAEIVAALTRQPSSLEVQPELPVFEFGASVALFDFAREIGISELVDSHVPRRGRRGPTPGQMLLLCALNRAVAPSSKKKLAAWYEGTSLPRLFGLKPGQLTSQRFWDAMDRVDEEAVAAIERDLTSRIVERFDLSLTPLFYDATNFFTFFDTFNSRPTLAQRGDSKEGRAALRILGLSLLVTGDFEVPLFHQLYPGNHNDPTSFRSAVDALVERARTVLKGVIDLTVVFDKGNNTVDTLGKLDGVYHVVGSLVPSRHRELFSVPREKMRRLDPARFPEETLCHRTEKTVFGRPYTVLVVSSEGLLTAQRKTLMREITKAHGRFCEEEVRLARWYSGAIKGGHLPTETLVRNRVNKILRRDYLKELFPVEIAPHPEYAPMAKLSWRFAPEAMARLEREVLGRTILFTDRKGWSDEEIVAAYRGQFHVENAFRQMKDVHYLSFRPVWHWTDQKLRVHALCCVMALTLCTLLRRRLAQRGITVSTTDMLDALSAIQEVHVLLSNGRGRPRLQRRTSKLSDLSRSLFRTLDLGRYLKS